MKKYIFPIILIILMLAFIELGAFIVYKVNPYSIMGWQSSSKIFDKVWIQDKNSKMIIPEGWAPYGISSRPDNFQDRTRCAAAFGDSFTHGDEVSDFETWAQAASQISGCYFRNYGVGGYGIDQAVIHYETVKPTENVILLGLTEPMFSRNLAASWIFIRPEIYLSQKISVLKPYFFFSSDKALSVRYPWEVNDGDIGEYHRHDVYYQPYKMNFPYTISLFNNIYYRLNKPFFIKQVNRGLDDGDTVLLAKAILDRFIEKIKSDNKKLVIIFIPEPRKLLTDKVFYGAFLADLKIRHPNICIIDGREHFTERAKTSMKNLIAKNGHYNKDGNYIIGENIVKNMKECGLF